MASQAARGKKALEASDFETAIKEYTAAIKESPSSADFYIQRATAYQRANRDHEALADAQQGVINAQKRAKKELIIDAQFRRGVALFKLGRFGDADFVLQHVKQLKPDHKQAEMWINKTKLSLGKLAEDDDMRKCTVTETPTMDANTGPGGEVASVSQTTSTATVSAPAKAQALEQTPAGNIRYEWYQSTENIYFTLLVKGAPKEKTHIEITERSMAISFPLLSGSSYDLTIEPLSASVVPEKCITRVLPAKVEVILIKAVAGQKWSKLESTEPVSSTKDSSDTKDEGVKRAVFNDSQKMAGPAYPTSSKSGPKDWDKISRDLRQTDSTKGSVDDDDDYEGGDEANHFFKKLFKHADPDTQRAMMKSYTESNGTALSTNWSEVSKGKVETAPPDGMEAKEWAK